LVGRPVRPIVDDFGATSDFQIGAVRTARAWMKRRVEAGQPAFSGMFTRAEVTYAWPRLDGTWYRTAKADRRRQ
jgi:hypothetical protein